MTTEPEKTKSTGEIRPREIVEEMRSAYINYAMSVIVGRALPDRLGREITTPANRRARPLHASVSSARFEVEHGARHTHRAAGGSSAGTACCVYAPRS